MWCGVIYGVMDIMNRVYCMARGFGFGLLIMG